MKKKVAKVTRRTSGIGAQNALTPAKITPEESIAEGQIPLTYADKPMRSPMGPCGCETCLAARAFAEERAKAAEQLPPPVEAPKAADSKDIVHPFGRPDLTHVGEPFLPAYFRPAKLTLWQRIMSWLNSWI